MDRHQGISVGCGPKLQPASKSSLPPLPKGREENCTTSLSHSSQCFKETLKVSLRSPIVEVRMDLADRIKKASPPTPTCHSSKGATRQATPKPIRI